MRKIFLFFLLLGILSILVGREFSHYLNTPKGDDRTIEFHVDRGATLKTALKNLEQQGVLEHPLWLYGYARLQKKTLLRAGYYDISAKQSPRAILKILNEGQVKTATIIFSEGLNRYVVRDKLVQEEWLSADTFDRLCDDQAFLREHNIPGPTCEGYLFPETYRFAIGILPEQIFAEMFEMFHKNFDPLLEEGRGPNKLSDQQLVTLASIVEKETGDANERSRIACVFYNRLNANPPWRLETDPTVIYGALTSDQGFSGNIQKKHLQMHNAYNTYKIYGLPKGPIANPGRAALYAVIHPDTCKDFYFVSKNNGQHVFCPDLRCHINAVHTWQISYFREKRAAQKTAAKRN